MITLGNAAKTLGISKAAVSKAISRGHLSAAKRDDGTFNIDPSELARWWEEARRRFQSRATNYSLPTTAGANSSNGLTPPADTHALQELRVRFAGAEAQITALQDILEVERRRSEELRVERDGWKSQAERLLIAAPIVATAAPPSPPQRRSWGWWGRRVA